MEKVVLGTASEPRMMFGSTSGPLFIAKPNAAVDFPCEGAPLVRVFPLSDEAGGEASERDEEGTNKQVVVVVVAAGQVLQLLGCLSVCAVHSTCLCTNRRACLDKVINDEDGARCDRVKWVESWPGRVFG